MSSYSNLRVVIAAVSICTFPSLALLFAGSDAEWIILLYEQACSIVIACLLMRNLCHYWRSEGISLGFLLLCTICVALGDLCNSITLINNLSQQSLPTSIGLPCYLCFALATNLALWFRYWKHSKKSSYLGPVTIFFLLSALQYKFTIIPLCSNHSNLLPFAKISYISYKVVECANVAFLVPVVLRIKSYLEHIFLQGLLLLHTAGFAVNYQNAHGTGQPHAWPAWPIALGTIAMGLYLDSGKSVPMFSSRPAMTATQSIRVGIVSLVCIVNILLVGFMISASIFSVYSGARLTELMLLLFLCWGCASWAAQTVSHNIESIASAMPTLVIADADGACTLATIEKRTFFAEVNKLVNGYNQLVKKSNELSELMVDKRRLIAVGDAACRTAHDIRSPLAALRVVEKEATQLPQDCKDLMKIAIASISDIADGLLDQYRSSSEEAAPLVQEENLCLLVELVAKEKRPVFGQRDVTLHFVRDSRSDAVVTNVSRTLFKRSLANLLQNAYEACDVGGTVTVHLTKSSAYALLNIRDTGKGIAAENLAKITQPGGTIGKRDGCGLGLSTAIQHVESWGGTLNIESQVGVGTQITVKLPSARS